MLVQKTPPGSQKCFSSPSILAQNVCPPFQSGWMHKHNPPFSNRLVQIGFICYVILLEMNHCSFSVHSESILASKGSMFKGYPGSNWLTFKSVLTKVFPHEGFLTQCQPFAQKYKAGGIPSRNALMPGPPITECVSRKPFLADFPSRKFFLTKACHHEDSPHEGFPTEVVLTNTLAHGSLCVQGSLGPAGQIQEIVFKGSWAQNSHD